MSPKAAYVELVATRGGSIIIMVLILIVLGVLLTIATFKGIGGESASLLRNAFSGFSGALLVALTTNTKPQDPTNQNSTQGASK